MKPHYVTNDELIHSKMQLRQTQTAINMTD